MYHTVVHTRVPLAARIIVIGLLTMLLASVLPLSLRAQAPNLDQLACREVQPVSGLFVGRSDVSELTAVPGNSFMAPVTLKNSYAYPLAELAVYGAVYRTDSAVPIDWFSVTSFDRVESGTEKQFDIAWSVPANLPGGEYELAVFAEQGTGVNPLSLSLARERAEAVFPVTVADSSNASAYFDLESISLNGDSVTIGEIQPLAADATDLNLAFDIVNQLVAQPVQGALSIALYRSFYPSEFTLIELEEVDARLVSGAVQTKTVSIPAFYDQYLLVANFEGVDGQQSRFVVPIERNGAAVDAGQPALSHLGVITTNDRTELVFCFDHYDNLRASTNDLTPAYPVEYAVSAQALTDGGEPGPETGRIAGTAELGGGIEDFGQRGEVVFPGSGATQVRVDLTWHDGQQETRLLSIGCVGDTCERMGGSAAGDSDPMQFIEKIVALMEQLSAATWVIIAMLTCLFLYSMLPLIRANRKRRVEQSPVTPEDTNLSK